ncbi:uncharacterized protein PV09_05918 [Verruconis gallopava]|uniref:Uncharacterized protein n=1 Tax=Verruconis gallopava TaxID=253628 RepID=A0A0D1XKK7_9PEZI|nr:uncharacterized protein PV09_05918 [Verruconis gallopava]KIW02866.1 hypothetical protein PV09_05918 [Verruconis gallopava]
MAASQATIHGIQLFKDLSYSCTDKTVVDEWVVHMGRRPRHSSRIVATPAKMNTLGLGCFVILVQKPIRRSRGHRFRRAAIVFIVEKGFVARTWWMGMRFWPLRSKVGQLSARRGRENGKVGFEGSDGGGAGFELEGVEQVASPNERPGTGPAR